MGRHPSHIPTPEEIRAACLELQATWTDAEHVRRQRLDRSERKKGVPPTFKPEPLTAPIISLSDLGHGQ